MQAANWGRIINVASVHGLVASAQKSAYVAAKHGIVGLTKAVALETATTGVTCNAICPGWVLTPLVQKQIDARAARERHRPTRRPAASCWARRSRRCSSPRPRSWASWRCSSARRPPTTCAAWPGTWTAAGRRNRNLAQGTASGSLPPRHSSSGHRARNSHAALRGSILASRRPSPFASLATALAHLHRAVHHDRHRAIPGSTGSVAVGGPALRLRAHHPSAVPAARCPARSPRGAVAGHSRTAARTRRPWRG